MGGIGNLVCYVVQLNNGKWFPCKPEDVQWTFTNYEKVLKEGVFPPILS